jgi:hypothetical protein
MAGRIAQLLTADPAEWLGSLNGQVDPRTGTAIGVAEALAELVARRHVAIDQRFLDDRGVDSMVIASFGVRACKRRGSPVVSVKDVHFVHAAQRACNDHSDFWFKGSA